jgi:hypothetical protein
LLEKLRERNVSNRLSGRKRKSEKEREREGKRGAKEEGRP